MLPLPLQRQLLLVVQPLLLLLLLVAGFEATTTFPGSAVLQLLLPSVFYNVEESLWLLLGFLFPLFLIPGLPRSVNKNHVVLVYLTLPCLCLAAMPQTPEL